MAEEVKETVENTEETAEKNVESEEKATDWEAEANPYKAEAAKYKRMAEQRGKKLEKYAEVGKDEAENSNKTQDNKPQSNEPDYGRLAFLNSSGITHPDDQKIVIDEAIRLNLPLTEIAKMEHIKSRLQANSDQREALAGTPKGTGRSGGKTQHDVDYWMNKEGDERPSDPELAIKVLNAKMAKQKQANNFSDTMYS